MDLGISRDLFVNASVRWVDMSPKLRFEGSDVGTVSLDPMIYSLNLGYRFGSLGAPAE